MPGLSLWLLRLLRLVLVLVVLRFKLLLPPLEGAPACNEAAIEVQQALPGAGIKRRSAGLLVAQVQRRQPFGLLRAAAISVTGCIRLWS